MAVYTCVWVWWLTNRCLVCPGVVVRSCTALVASSIMPQACLEYLPVRCVEAFKKGLNTLDRQLFMTLQGLPQAVCVRMCMPLTTPLLIATAVPLPLTAPLLPPSPSPPL